MGTNAESVKVGGSATGNRSPIRFDDFWRKWRALCSPLCYVSGIPWGLTSLPFFLSLSLYSPFLRLLEIDDRRSTMTRVYVPVLPPIDPPSGPVRVLKQTRRSRCDPFIPTRTSTSFHTPFVLLLVVLFLRLFAPYLPTYLSSVLHVARSVFSLSETYVNALYTWAFYTRQDHREFPSTQKETEREREKGREISKYLFKFSLIVSTYFPSTPTFHNVHSEHLIFHTVRFLS